MIKQLMLAVATLVATMGFAMAQVDVNKADAPALDGIKGIGPKTSKAIIDERTKNGPFKDWADFEKRVQGVGEKSARKLSSAGLTVGGKPLDGTSVAAAPKGEAKKAAATAK
ncbi:ComEA family DNA-binding protein [Massilia sp. DWR3-1-1]|uniref:ComEA family DNA-binding protein n=1 Tax=Massilia sp. DWR3-1-1 TaxID=2804559 RepID=UPI003CEE0751